MPEFHRRDFLKLVGASAGAAAAAGCGEKVTKLIPYVIQPEEIVPGIANYYASTCQECPAGCGLLVKTREGRPIKLDGNPEHPVNQGALCARGQASIGRSYHPDRYRSPMKRVDGKLVPTTLGRRARDPVGRDQASRQPHLGAQRADRSDGERVDRQVGGGGRRRRSRRLRTVRSRSAARSDAGAVRCRERTGLRSLGQRSGDRLRLRLPGVGSVAGRARATARRSARRLQARAPWRAFRLRRPAPLDDGVERRRVAGREAGQRRAARARAAEGRDRRRRRHASRQGRARDAARRRSIPRRSPSRPTCRSRRSSASARRSAPRRRPC